jgi:hypothetical protein
LFHHGGTKGTKVFGGIARLFGTAKAPKEPLIFMKFHVYHGSVFYPQIEKQSMAFTLTVASHCVVAT